MRTSFLRLAPALALVAITACEDAPTAPTVATPPATLVALSASTECPACVFGPKTFTRSSGQPVTERFEIPGDPAADYMLDVTDHGSQGANASVSLNGELIAGPEQIGGEGEFHLRRAVAMRDRSVLEVRLTGKPGSRLSIVLHGGTKLLGNEGGTVRAPGSGATIRVAAGSLRDTTLVQLTDAPLPAANSANFSAVAHHLQFALPGFGASFAPGAVLTLELPRADGTPVTAPVVIRTRFAGSTMNFWAYPADPTAPRVRLDIPTDSLSQINDALALTVFDALFTLEPTVAPGMSPTGADRAIVSRVIGEGSASLVAFPSLDAPIVIPWGSCRSLPQPSLAFPSDLAPCSNPQLRRDLLQDSSAPAGGSAIVLVHGWNKDIDNWVSYYQKEGVNCASFDLSGACKPTQRQGLPATDYFLTLRQALLRDVPDVRLYLFDYESWRSVADNGQALAALLERTSGIDRVLLVGHSMGGLVARVAAQRLERDNKGALVQAIFTLGTPHTGTPAARAIMANVFSPGLRTAGGDDLTAGVLRNETVPLYVYGGQLYSPTSDDWLQWGAWYLCSNNYPDGCLNDGVVPLKSALATEFTGPGITRRPRYDQHDHYQLKDGIGDLRQDPLYKDLLADLKAQLAVIRRSDLVVTLPTCSAGMTFTRGARQDIPITFTNVGTRSVAAGSYVGAGYLSTNASIDASDLRLISSSGTPMLAPNEPKQLQDGGEVPASFAPGTYYLLYRVDADDQVEESDEGNNIAICPGVRVVAPTSGLLFQDSFSSGLGNWVERDPDNLATWVTQDGELIGDYSIGCGSRSCHQSQLLLVDALQPSTANWRMEVRSGLVEAYCCFNGGAMSNLAKFALWVSDTEKDIFEVGQGWQGMSAPAVASSVYTYHQSGNPWTIVGSLTATVPEWRPAEWQTAALEKRGNQYTVFFNGVQVYTVTRTFSRTPKLGLQTYGRVRMDDFRMYAWDPLESTCRHASLSIL